MALITTVALQGLLDLRFDAECHRPELQAAERRVAGHPVSRLDELASVSDGNHVSIAAHYCDAGVRYLKGAELSDPFIDDSDPTFIPPDIDQQIPRAHVHPGDVLLSVIGSVGQVGLVTAKVGRLSCSCKLAILRPHKIPATLLVAYLLSPTGQALLLRRNRGSVQQGIVLPDVRSFPVPAFSDALARDVESLLGEAEALKRRADALYPAAEAELLERMGWPQLARRPVERTYTTTLQRLTEAARFDAEFFHPRCARLRDHLADHGRDLGDLLTDFNKGVQPRSYDPRGAVAVVKSKQIGPRGLSMAACERTDENVWTDVSARLQPGDLVLTSTGRGTLGRAAVVPPFDGRAVAAVDVLRARLDPTTALPEYVALFLNSPAGQLQSEQHQTGSSGQLHLYPQHFRRLRIFLPRQADGSVDLAWQRRLVADVAESMRAGHLAREKLEAAKRAVEAHLG